MLSGVDVAVLVRGHESVCVVGAQCMPLLSTLSSAHGKCRQFNELVVRTALQTVKQSRTVEGIDGAGHLQTMPSKWEDTVVARNDPGTVIKKRDVHCSKLANNALRCKCASLHVKPCRLAD